MATERVDAPVVFGATGDLARLETLPALVGLVERGVLDVPVVGVAESGCGLEQFRAYACASLRLNGMDPTRPAALGERLRFRAWPETVVGLTVAGKEPGANWEPQVEDLPFAGHPSSDTWPYDRLIGAALGDDRWLFARQDTVEAAWQVVEPVLGDVTPVHPYARGKLGTRGGRPAAAPPRLLALPPYSRPDGTSSGGATWHTTA